MSEVDLTGSSIRELLALWANALRELRKRRVVRTFNSPIGDIAEELWLLCITAASEAPSARRHGMSASVTSCWV
jgi:hypothetical protein